MATRSRIAVEINNKYWQIYCHNDGYLDGVGTTLIENYTTLNKVTGLVSMGHMSVLGERVTPLPVGVSMGNIWREGHTITAEEHHFDNKQKGTCVFYHRDRGDDYEVDQFDDKKDLHREEFNYLFRNNQWYWMPESGKRWRKLKV